MASLAIVAISSLQALALDPALPPGSNFDLSHWYLGLPYDGPDSDIYSDSISVAQLVAGYTNELYFYTGSDGAMVFWAPVDGATTSGSSYPRSELREQIVVGNNDINWYGSGTHILTAQCRVTELPSSEKVIIGQIHSKTGLARPLVKIYYDGSKNPNRVRILVKQSPDDPENSSDTSFDFPDVPLNGLVDYMLKMEDGLVTMTVNGDTQTMDVYASDPDWASQQFYFKAGSYCQDNSGPSTEGARVAFYALSTSHQANSPVDLAVSSAYGTPTPSVGTATYSYNSLINAAVPDSPVVGDTIRHVATGWTGTGDVVAGSGTNTSFNLTQNSSITWLWQTQHWLNIEATAGGAVDVSNGWFNAGTNVTITAIAEAGYHFLSWSGDSTSTNAVLNLTIDTAKSVTANFAADLPSEVYIPMPEVVGGGVQFTVPSVSNALYQLEYTDSLSPTAWEPMGSAVIGTGNNLDLADPGPLTTNRYYRLIVHPSGSPMPGVNGNERMQH